MLWAILWAKALISHLEAGGWSLAKTLFSVGAERSMKAYSLICRNRLAAYRRWTGGGAGWNSLSDLGRRRRSAAFQHSTCHVFFILSYPVQAFNVAVNNPTAARAMTSNSIGEIMGEIIRFVSKSERERARLFREARAIYDSLFPPSDPVREQRDKASANHMRIGADVHPGEGDLS